MTTSEANTQAEFYHHARIVGLPVALEVDTPVGRLDIAILREDGSGIVAAVECKRDGRALTSDSHQIRRYKSIGVPVYGLTEFEAAGRLVATIDRKHRNDVGVSWAVIRAMPKMVRARRGVRLRDSWLRPDRHHIAY